MINSSKLALVLTAIPAVFAATYDVNVGPGGRLVYEPEYVMAVPGDVVNFIFNPKNHTVTQSAFDSPCVPAGAVNSGFMPVTPDTSPLPTFQVTVNDGNPIWIHCQQTGHCAQGMVFAINPPIEGDRTFAAFKQLAMSGASAPPATATSPAGWQMATATVTYGGSVYTTTYTSYDGTPPPTPAAQPSDHKIIVGENGQLTYNPDHITAAVRDTVTFEFRAKNHTVTQSSFANPCSPFVGSDGAPGFSSGFRPVAAGATEFPTFQITINDTAPIWGYCQQTGHCAQGMVFSINSVESGPNNYAAFKAKAQSGSATTTPTGTADSAGNSAVRGTVQVGLAGAMVVLGLVHLIL